jgi:hypothetical protein
MAVEDYRFRVPNPPAIRIGGEVKFEVFVEVCDAVDPEAWSQIDGGHFELTIAGALLEQATSGQQVLQYIGNYIRDRGIVQADRARRKVLQLVGGQWADGGYTQALDLSG